MQTSLAIRKYSLLKRLKEALKPLCVNYIIGEGQDRTPIRAVIFLSLKRFVGKCVSPTFAMPRRGMASLANVGLDEKPWLSASLAWLITLPARSSREGEGLRRGTLEGRAGRDFSKRRSESWRANEGIHAGDFRVVTRLKPEAFY